MIHINDKHIPDIMMLSAATKTLVDKCDNANELRALAASLPADEAAQVIQAAADLEGAALGGDGYTAETAPGAALVAPPNAQCEQWVFRSVNEMESPEDGPSRCFVSLDMVNMFNRMSRKECRRVLEAHVPSLLPLFDATCGGTNTVWYQTPNGPFTSFEQEEGFAQGDPLAPLFASLVLQKVLQPIQDEQRARAKRRKSRFPGDDKKGGAATLGACIDDAGSVVPWIDVYWLLQRFVAIGGPLDQRHQDSGASGRSAIANQLTVPKKHRSLYSPLECLVRFHPIDSLASYLCDKSAQLNYDRLRSGARRSNPCLPVARFDADGSDVAPSIQEAASLPASTDWGHHFSWDEVAKAVPEILDSGFLRGLVHTSRRNRMYEREVTYFVQRQN